MSELFHLSEIAHFDPSTFPSDLRVAERANVHRYENILGQINEIYDYVDEDGVVVGCGVSTNIEGK